MRSKLKERHYTITNGWGTLIPLHVKETRLTEVDYFNEAAMKKATEKLWQHLKELARGGKLKELNLIL